MSRFGHRTARRLAARAITRRAVTRLVCATAAMALALAAGEPGGPARPEVPQAAASSGVPNAGDAAIASGLLALHRGEYRRALDDFKRAADNAPGSPGPLFYPVFARWWQGLFSDGGDSRPDAAFDDAYGVAVTASQGRLEDAARDVDALATLGCSQILKAHVEAMRGNYWRSGQEARRGKKSLEQALAADSERETALFGMGALNYFADRVPLIVKGMRVLFFMPGGDADLGLRQIRRVADGRGPMRTDGRLLLGMVCADRYQMAYGEALRHLERALDETGGSPLIRAAIGDLLIRLARYDDAAAMLRAGLAESEGGDPESARRRRWLTLGLAEALAGDWRLEEAEAALRRSVAETSVAGDSLQRVERRITAEIAERRAAAQAWSASADRARPAAASPDAAGAPDAAGPPACASTAERRVLEESVRDGGGTPAGRLLLGRCLLAEGRSREAVRILREAHRRLPREASPWLAGSVHLALGTALQASGDAEAARTELERAMAVRRYRGADAARQAIGTKGENSAVCAP